MYLRTAKALSAALVLLAATPLALAFGEPDPSYLSTPLANWSCQEQFATRADESAFVTMFSRGVPQMPGVARFNADGALDRTWGKDGVATFQYGFMQAPHDIVAFADGSVMLLGDVITRLSPDGRVDAGYGSNGVSDPVTVDGLIYGYARQADGSMVVVGWREVIDAYRGTIAQLVMTRVGVDGRRDAGFGQGGYIQIDVDPNNLVAWSVVSSNVAEVTIMERADDGTSRVVLRQFPGRAVPAGETRLMPRTGLASWMAPAASVDPFGNVMLATGENFNTFIAHSAGIAVYRFKPSGQLDPAFGTGGRAFTPVSGKYTQDPSRIFAKALWRSVTGEWNALAGVDQSMGGFSLVDLDARTKVVRLLADGIPDPRFPQQPDLGGWQLTRFMRLANGDIIRNVITAEGCALERMLGDPPAEGALVEYYQPTLDHYFMTLEGSEAALLDANVATMGWKRTGFGFGAWMPSSLPGTKKLCRFYGDVKAGPNSHFYTPEGAECDSLRALDAATPLGQPAWRFEGYAGSVTDASDGTCPANLDPVYRVYNRGFEKGGVPNHRYMTDTAVYAQMQSQGWVGEGVRFCVPLRSSSVSTY